MLKLVIKGFVICLTLSGCSSPTADPAAPQITPKPSAPETQNTSSNDKVAFCNSNGMSDLYKLHRAMESEEVDIKQAYEAWASLRSSWTEWEFVDDQTLFEAGKEIKSIVMRNDLDDAIYNGGLSDLLVKQWIPIAFCEG
jgi:hypothetical protein